MGQATDAILAYGYDLGGDGWKLEGLGEYGELPPLDWWDDEDDFATAAERHLLTQVAGFTETWADRREGYFDRERAAKARLGVTIDTYCSGSCPMYILAAYVATVKRGDCEVIYPAGMSQRPAEEGWDAKLTAALDALGIRPTQERAQWLLCSYWG